MVNILRYSFYAQYLFIHPTCGTIEFKLLPDSHCPLLTATSHCIIEMQQISLVLFL